MKRIKFDGEYVKESDGYDYLVNCPEEQSEFSDEVAQSMKKQCPDRIEIVEVE